MSKPSSHRENDKGSLKHPHDCQEFPYTSHLFVFVQKIAYKLIKINSSLV